MLLARKINLNQLKNAVISQQVKIFSQLQSSRTLCTTSYLTKQSENQAGSTAKTSRVYYGLLTPQIRAVKVFSLTTSIIGVTAQPMLYAQAAKMATSTPVIFGLCGIVGFFTFVTPILIHFITKKYITELHYDDTSKEYIATTINFFLIKKQLKFKPEDVVVPDVTGAFTSFHVKDRTTKKEVALFVEPRLFEDPSHYVKIMGYDKPIDFKFELSHEGEENKAEKK